MGPIGIPEMIAIFVIALVLFGPKKMPELGRNLGKALSEFRRAKNELKSTFESHLHELEKETQLSTSNTSTTSSYSSTNYSYPYEDYNQYDPASGSYGSGDSYGSHENGSSPSATSTTTTPEADVHHDPATKSKPVEGTVPRSTSAPNVGSVEVPAQEQHSA